MDPLVIIPYLDSDRDRVHLLQTCRDFVELMPKVQFTDRHAYDQVSGAIHKYQFTNVHFTTFYEMVPEGVTHVQFIWINKIGQLPKSVKSITVPYNADIPPLPGVRVEFQDDRWMPSGSRNYSYINDFYFVFTLPECKK